MLRANVALLWVGVIALCGILSLGQAPCLPCAEEGPFGHISCSDGDDNDCDGLVDQDDPTCDPEDLNMTVGDFECIRNWEQPNIGGATYYFTNLRDNVEGARSVANSPNGGTFPPGTIVQILPNEAMVKRAEGWNPSTNDWEFFKLAVIEQRTEIRSRGTETVRNIAGTCFGCHKEAFPQWDMICGDDDLHGCNPLPALVTDELILSLQCSDSRCDQPCE